MEIIGTSYINDDGDVKMINQYQLYSLDGQKSEPSLWGPTVALHVALLWLNFFDGQSHMGAKSM